MDPMWLDREKVDATLAGVEWGELRYDPSTGLYVVAGVPFTGACKRRYPDGALSAVGQFKGGVPAGPSASWYPGGQIKVYSEMLADIYDGWHIEWDADGTKRAEEYHERGRLVPKPTG